jgi:hypothetical protein
MAKVELQLWPSYRTGWSSALAGFIEFVANVHGTPPGRQKFLVNRERVIGFVVRMREFVKSIDYTQPFNPI